MTDRIRLIYDPTWIYGNDVYREAITRCNTATTDEAKNAADRHMNNVVMSIMIARTRADEGLNIWFVPLVVGVVLILTFLSTIIFLSVVL